ncbi:probable replication factor A 73 kDa subunit isoform X1 [Panicum hallii]|uniref:probable replication factor A 73 kDa subunit isoform X1 n=1 Tax=Panicum hallii TaxID=206008 RepID=UPI000DF4CFE8|nr:probable replication factor A 73 kDa subunit isoform X1 [Panicum hallii]
MEITPVSQVRPGRLNYSLHVRISRMWEFRSTNEQNDIKHLDLVLIDQKGSSIYAEIPPEVIADLKPHLQERKIVYMSKITIEPPKLAYRVVDNPYMVKLNKRTVVVEDKDEVPGFPKYTFSLIPLDKLEQYKNKTDRFIDVIAKIRTVTNATKVTTASGDQQMRRVILLEDLKANTIESSLSGKRALEFDGDQVIHVGQHHHVIAIFVGTLVKLYKGHYPFLSGTSACRWYINENDIAEIKVFQKSLPSDPIRVQKTYLQIDADAAQKFEDRTLQELKHVDPFLDMFSYTLIQGQRYQCTATIIGIIENQTWCYRACKICNSRMIQKENNYECAKEGCPSTQFEWKYKIPFIASDHTYKLEFMFFEKKGMELIGKSASTLIKQYKPKEIPPEISAWIGYKFTFIVRVLSKKSVNAADPSFEVLMIKERFGKEPIISFTSSNEGVLPESSSSFITEFKDLPLLIPITSKDTKERVQDAGETQDMEIEPFGICEEAQSSNKRSFGELDNHNQEINNNNEDPSEDNTTKRMRSQEKSKN